MLGWALYLTIALITGSLMKADVGSCSLYCAIFRFWITVEKNYSKPYHFFKFWFLQQVLFFNWTKFG